MKTKSTVLALLKSINGRFEKSVLKLAVDLPDTKREGC